MSIQPVTTALTKFAKSGIGQKIYGSLLKPNKERFLNNTLPLVEGVTCSLAYCYATATNKKIPKEQKETLQYQNIINGVAGITLSGVLNTFVSKQGDKIIQNLKPELVKDFEGVSRGIRTVLPIVTTGLCMRYIVPVASAPISSFIKKIRGKEKKLDTKV